MPESLNTVQSHNQAPIKTHIQSNEKEAVVKYDRRFGDIIVDVDKLKEIAVNIFKDVVDRQTAIDLFTWIDIENRISEAVNCSYNAYRDSFSAEPISEWKDTSTYIWKEEVEDIVICRNNDYKTLIYISMTRIFFEKDNVRTLIDFSEPKIETVKIERREEM